MIGENAQSRERPELTRGVGAWAAIAVNVTNMIGAGVFLKTRVMTCNVGSAKLVLLVWLAAGLLSLAGTFCYSEMAALMPEAGGDYVYLRRAYGRVVGFLFGWMAFAVFRTGAQAALPVSLAIFLNVALGGRSRAAAVRRPVGGLTLAALATIWTVTLINCATVSAGGRTALAGDGRQGRPGDRAWASARFCLRREIGRISRDPDAGALRRSIRSARGGVAGFGAAMLGALWAYDGWNNVAPLAGEIRNPQRNLPRAFIGGMLIVAALYLFVNTRITTRSRPSRSPTCRRAHPWPPRS